MRKNATAVLLFVTIFILHQQNARAQWVPLNIPSDMHISTILISGNNIFAGTEFGIYRSTNKGTNWTPENNGLSIFNSVFVFALTAVNNKIFASANGMFVSKDNGINWEQDTSFPINTSAFTLATSGNNVLAESNNGLFITTNDGINWSRQDSVPTYIGGGINPDQTIITNNNIVFAAGGEYGNDIYYSNDFGINWRWKGKVFSDTAEMRTFPISSLIMNGADLYVGVEGFGVYRSTDSGASWNPINLGLKLDSIYSQIFPLASIDSTLFVGSDSGIYRSVNKGASWDLVNNGLKPGIQINTFAVNGGIIYAATNYGLYFSNNDGDNWTPQNAGMGYGQTELFPTVLNGSVLFLRTTDVSNFTTGMYRSTDNGMTWENIAPVVALRPAFAIKKDTIYAGEDLGEYGPSGFYRSTDSGANWINIDSVFWGILYNRHGDNGGFGAIGIKGNNVLASGYGDIYRSTDGGENWSIPDSMESLGALAFTFKGDTVFASTYYGVYQSTNYGIDWKADTIGLDSIDISAFVVSNNNIFVGTGGNTGNNIGKGIYRSTNNGGSWTAANNGIPATSVCNDLLVLSGNLFAATDSGAFLSTNEGFNWLPVNDGLTSPYVNTFAVSGDYLLTETLYGIFRRPLSDFGITAVNEKQTDLPSQPALSNYPNPFSISTNVEYQIPNEEMVTLKVYNSLGVKVATLVDGEQSAGVHSVPFQSNDLQNGIYFYRLTAGKLTQ